MPPGAGFELDDVLMKDGTETDDADDYGLELDAQQAAEVRQIFFTTLPQYLEPIEQLLEQIFGSESTPQDLCSTLMTTVSSIGAAAARIGVPNAVELLERMQDALLPLVDHVGPPPQTVREAVERELSALRALTSGTPSPRAPHGQTLVAAFASAPHLDRSVLEKLTAAGLVTVDQIDMAEPREIAAVTGLSMDVVQQLIAALANLRPRSSVPAHAAESEPRTAETALRAKLHELVEAEAAVQETQAALVRLRANHHALQREISAASAQRDGLRARLDAARARCDGLLADLSQVDARHAACVRARAHTEDSLSRTRAYVQRLRQDQRAIRAEQASCASELHRVSSHVRALVATAARARSADGERLRGQEDPDR